MTRMDRNTCSKVDVLAAHVADLADALLVAHTAADHLTLLYSARNEHLPTQAGTPLSAHNTLVMASAEVAAAARSAQDAAERLHRWSAAFAAEASLDRSGVAGLIGGKEQL